MSKSLLVLGYGNPSRGDDALGPLLLDYIEQQLAIPNLELLTDFQLQIEHALDLQNRELVLFVDASVKTGTAFEFTELHPTKDNSYTSHAMSPAAILHVYQSITAQTPPPCFLLGIQGMSFELGAELSDHAAQHLQQACVFTQNLLTEPSATAWRRQIDHLQTVV